MKCPKCGYNSFEHHDICTKCANDLTAYKATFGLTAIVLPHDARTAMAESLKSETVEDDQAPETAATGGDMFTFDIPEEAPAEPAATTAATANPFSFDEEPDETPSQAFGQFSFDEPAATQSAGFGDFSFEEPAPPPPQELGDISFDDAVAPQTPGVADIPADGEQQSAQAKAEEDAFASLLELPSIDDPGTAAQSSPLESTPSDTSNEFDLDSFSWDTTPATETGVKPDNDLNTLFGAPEDVGKK